jgi:hypothetical protein
LLLPIFLQLERFLIENRDEYLRHSSKNYTAEQKQYNNRLTEELLEVAEQYHYVFDPEEFNFVAIRDRIRCYYKSYVQTARKRGLSVSSAISPSSKRSKVVMKESKGTDTETDIKGEEEKGDVAIDKETDEQPDIKGEEEKGDAVMDKETDEQPDVKGEEKGDVVMDKETEDQPDEQTDDKQSDDKSEDDKIIRQEESVDKDTIEKDTSEKETVGQGEAEGMDTADAKEAQDTGAAGK